MKFVDVPVMTFRRAFPQIIPQTPKHNARGGGGVTQLIWWVISGPDRVCVFHERRCVWVVAVAVR